MCSSARVFVCVCAERTNLNFSFQSDMPELEIAQVPQFSVSQESLCSSKADL